MSIGIIYIATCIINNKSYIGKTSRSLSERVKEHKQHYKRENTKLYIAIRKHGWENFTWNELASCISSASDLNELEIFLIKENNTFGNLGYNGTLGGDGIAKGSKLSDETKKKISEANKGKIGPWSGKSFSTKHKENLSKAAKGKPKSEEHKSAMAKSHVGMTGKIPYNKGKNSSEETKAKLKEKWKTRTKPKRGLNGKFIKSS